MTEPATRPTHESAPRFVPPVREGETVAGKYLVGTQLGLGGMGVVHSARDLLLDRRVALKVLLPRLVASPTAGTRFLREARAATRISSEHVVKLLEIDTLPDGTPLLVMEYLEGKDLRAVLRELGPLAPRLAVDYLLQALQAVAEGHTHGIVHRDVKPSNLFLTRRADGTALIKVLDFGIAKTLESGALQDLSLTNSEDLQLGSPTYMPPEQFRSPRDVDARADIWALGVTLYELISGKVPFHGQSYADLVSRVLNSAPEPLKPALPDVLLPAGLERVVLRCLEKNRDQRYRDAAELAVALAPYGSEDARLSLTRVTGLSRQCFETPPSVTMDLRGLEMTMPVAPDPALAPSHTDTAGGSQRPASNAYSGSPHRGITLGAVAVAAVVSLGVWQNGRAAAPLAAVRPKTLAAPPATSPQPTPEALGTAPPDASGRAETVAAAPSASVLPSRTAASKGVRKGPHSAPSHADASDALVANSVAPKPAASTTNESGRSALIESLIQRRH